jgi:2-phosphosulfolactate phosphatase
MKNDLEVCFSPSIYKRYEDPESITVVVDIFRATTAICTAFDYGIEKIIPVGTIEQAREYKNKGYLIAAERDGQVIDFADFGNSPFNFMKKGLEGKTIVYSTTNGTQAVQMAAVSSQVIIGAFVNHTALVNYLVEQNKKVVILCAGWKKKFSLEDAVYAGALADALINSDKYYSICDSVTASLQLWENARKNLMAYKENFAHRHRLKKMMLDDVVEYCLSLDKTDKVPRFNGEFIMDYRSFNF